MVAETQIAQSLDRRQNLLSLIPGYELDYLIKRDGIKKDLIIGLIGERGGGKSGSGAVITLVDFMMNGIKCYSNMSIACDVVVDDITARKHGFTKGGIVTYRSLPVDIPALLRFDEMYRDSVIFLDEINVEIADARRAMSNTNLFSNRVAQEIRHLESAILFTCISEMAVDPRWRDIVDCYIKCEDTAYFPENIARRKPIGVDFAWAIYYMNKCFNGTTYEVTKMAHKGIVFHFKPWRGVYNDKEFQGEGMIKYGVDLRKEEDGSSTKIQDLMIGDAPKAVEFRKTWGWFEPIAKIIIDHLSNVDDYYLASKIWNSQEVLSRGFTPADNRITKHLRQYYHIKSRYGRFNGRQQTVYEFEDKDDPDEE